MREFINIEKYGSLCIDKVLFESYFPIIFTCLNNKKEIFICVCCKNNEDGIKWLVGKTRAFDIIQMLQNQITIRELLLDHSEGRISVDYVDGHYIVEYSNSDWDENSVFLPKIDSFMNPEEDEFDDEIEYFKAMDDSVYDLKGYSKLLEKKENISKSFKIDNFASLMVHFISAVGKIEITSEISNTLSMECEYFAQNIMNNSDYTDKNDYKELYRDIYESSINEMEYNLEINNLNFLEAA